MMKYFIVLWVLFFFNPDVQASSSMDTEEFTQEEFLCYAKAMNGFDFVINARLGMQPEIGVYLVGYGTPLAEFYLEAILGAYLWTASPHQYAVKTFAKCIKTINTLELNQ